MFTVKIQKMDGYAVVPRELVDITDRIFRDSLTRFSERIEAGRFSFTANDIRIKMINFDNLIYPEQTIPRGWLYNSFFTYVYLDGVEIFRGITSYSDVSFSDAPLTEVEWTAYSWLRRLREYEIEEWEAPVSLSALYSELEELIHLTPGTPHFEPSDIDLTGVLDITFGVEVGQSEPPDFVYDDLWRDPKSGRFFAVRWNELSQMVEFYEVKGNRHTLKRSWYVVSAAERVDHHDSTRFLRAVIGEGLCCIVSAYNYKDLLGHSHNVKTAYTFNVDEVVVDETPLTLYRHTIAADIDRYIVKNDPELGPIRIGNAGEVVRYAGGRVYVFVEITGGIRVIKKTVSGGAVGVYDITENVPENIYAIDVPYANKVVWYDRIGGGGRWFWIKWDMSGGFSGTVNTGDVITMTAPYYQVSRLYPVAHEDDYYCGKYHYYLWINNLGESFIEWWINDPIFIILSSMTYKNVTLEDILIDLAQFFNGVFFTRNGIVYIVNRGDSRGETTISTDYILNANYSRDLRDDSQVEPRLRIKAQGASDDEDDQYSIRTLMGTLRTYYRASIRWIRRGFVIPAEIGKDIGLGAKVTIAETGESGVVVQREITDESKGKMAKLVIEIRNT